MESIILALAFEHLVERVRGNEFALLALERTLKTCEQLALRAETDRRNLIFWSNFGQYFDRYWSSKEVGEFKADPETVVLFIELAKEYVPALRALAQAQKNANLLAKDQGDGSETIFWSNFGDSFTSAWLQPNELIVA